MIDLESMVKDELETTWNIESIIEEELQATVSIMVEQWTRNHDLKSWVSDAIGDAISKSDIADACETAIGIFVEDAIR